MEIGYFREHRDDYYVIEKVGFEYLQEIFELADNILETYDAQDFEMERNLEQNFIDLIWTYINLIKRTETKIEFD